MSEVNGRTPIGRTGVEQTHLVLVRHGETVWHAENRYAGGGSDVDLTERGRCQAEALAKWPWSRTPDVVVSSPVRRAIETAAPVAAALGTELIVLDDERAYKLLQSYCAKPFARGFKLYKLYTRAAAFIGQ